MHADEPLPLGYVIEISAVNKIMTDAPANLVPESPLWRVLDNTDGSVTETEAESDWENKATTPYASSFADNLTARGALGQIAMSIGSTAVWNSSILFPTEVCSEDDENYSKSDTTEEIIEQYIETWKMAPIYSSVASIIASYPRKEETDDDNSLSSNSYFYIENEDTEMESDLYSIESNDERKRPAKSVIKARRQLRIKREEEEEDIVLPSAPNVVNEHVTPPHVFNQKEEVFNEVAIPDWIKSENAPMLRPTWVRQEGYDYFDLDEYEKKHF